MRLKDYTDLPNMAQLVNLAELGETAKSITALQCPFCGGDPEVQLGLAYRDCVLLSVACSACRISTPRLITGQMISGNTYTLQDRLQEAAQLWNRRI